MGEKGKVLITGANGFVGSALVKLMSCRGFSLVPVVRKVTLGDGGRSTEIGDYCCFNGWDSLLAGIDVVIHLAARVHQLQYVSEQDYYAVNVEVSKKIALAAKKSRLRRFVYLSSIKVNGEVTVNGKRFSGIDKPAPKDAYGRSKLLAESSLREIFKDSDTELVIIRPPLVYGPEVRANFKKLTWLAGLPLPLPFAAVDNKRDMVSVLNLCELIVLCCSHPDASKMIWMVADEHAYSLASLLAEIRRTNHRSPALFNVPVSLLKRLFSISRMSSLSDRLFADLQVDIMPTKEILGWMPTHSFTQTMAPIDETGNQHD